MINTALNSAVHSPFLVTLLVLTLFDTLLGIVNSFQNKSVSSSVGRKGITQKAAVMIAAFFFDVIGSLSSDLVPAILLSGILVFLSFFELVSIAENLSDMGIEIPVLTKYLQQYEEKENHKDE